MEDMCEFSLKPKDQLIQVLSQLLYLYNMTLFILYDNSPK